MSTLKALALAALVAGLSLLAYGASRGEVELRLLLVFPLVTARGAWPALGILLLMAAGVLWFAGSVRDAAALGAPPSERAAQQDWGETPRTRGGGIVLLGPIPIVWGSDRSIVKWLMIGGALLLALGLLFTWGLR